MANAIPDKQRRLVQQRERHRCLRCNGVGAEWHHRRPRRVSDDHQHCACVGVWLCSTCHKWVHANPFEARRQGWIVSQWQKEPCTVPVILRTWPGTERTVMRYQNCDGTTRFEGTG